MITAQGLWEFLMEPAALAVLAVTAVIAWPIGSRLAARVHCHRAAAVLFVLAVGVVLALTLTPSPPSPGVTEVLPPHYVTQLDEPRRILSALIAPPSDGEQIANIALYLPIGFLGRLVWRSVARATFFGTALTVFVETCQYWIIGREGSFTDMRNNALGALVGALLAAALTRQNLTSRREIDS